MQDGTHQGPLKILVYGDSYANFRRFDDGIEGACDRRGIPVEVKSIAHSGHHTGKLLERWDGDTVEADLIVLVCGINDVVGRRGVAAFRQSLGALIEALGKVSPRIILVEIPQFDEDAPLARRMSEWKRKISALLHDRHPDRIARYREVQRESGLQIATTSDFLSRYDEAKFKDGIHFTDAQFVLLGRHVGEQVAVMIATEGQI